jgi:hypothetical protein
MARYGTLIAWAEALDHDDIIRLLNTNLNEEKAEDKNLSSIALRKGCKTERLPADLVTRTITKSWLLNIMRAKVCDGE